MFITIKDISTGTLIEEPLNTYSINYIYIKEEDNKKQLIYVLINGLRKIEEFDTEAKLQQKLLEIGSIPSGGLVQKDTYAELPDHGNSGAIYITKDTGQTYYWDRASSSYIKTGTAGRTGVYSYDGELPTTVGTVTTLNKSALEVIVEPTVPYSDGSEVSAINAVHALITSSTANQVTVKTVTDMVIDSFRQVADVASLPAEGEINILYAIKDIKEFRVWNSTTSEYEAYPLLENYTDSDIDNLFEGGNE